MPVDDFKQLIGEIIHLCGVIEFMINDWITSEGKDPDLANAAVRLGLGLRITLLKKMLKRRSFPDRAVDSVCKQLEQILTGRNNVAHNPIGFDSEGELCIFVFRGECTKLKRLNENDLETVLKHVIKAQKDLSNLLYGLPKPRSQENS